MSRSRAEREGAARPITVDIADLRDPDDPGGRTYRQVNAARAHTIPVGTLVEFAHDPDDDRRDGVRLYVVFHGRDCDMTPLYYLSANRRDTVQEDDRFRNRSWVGGFSEDSIRPVAGEGNDGAA